MSHSSHSPAPGVLKAKAPAFSTAEAEEIARRQRYVLPHSAGTIITSPGDDRLPTQYVWDFGVGKHFNLGKQTDFSIYLQILNILNDDAITGWQTLAPRGGGELIPDQWVLPRRANIRLRFAF